MPSWPFSSSNSAEGTTPNRIPACIDRNAVPPTLQGLANNDLFSPSPLCSEVLNSPAAAPSSPKRLHARSLSNTLPSLFGGNKKKPTQIDDSLSKSSTLTGDGSLQEQSSPKRKMERGKGEEGEFDTGKCATCDSKIKWVKGALEYRCGTCLMVNGYKESGLNENPMPLTLERTQTIIDSCIQTYLQGRKAGHKNRFGVPIDTSPRSPDEGPAMKDGNTKVSYFNDPTTTKRPIRRFPSPGNLPTNASYVSRVPTVENPRHLAHASSSPSLSRSPPDTRSPPRISSRSIATNHHALPTRNPPVPPVTHTSASSIRRPLPLSVGDGSPEIERDKSRSRSTHLDTETSGNGSTPINIFKPLEDYIVKTFGAHHCLNSAFARSRPNIRGPTGSEDNVRGHPPTSPASKSRPVDSTLSQVDAKTLLLGDVAENGLWWTGRHERADASNGETRRNRSASHADELVQSRSPRIDFVEVAQWYRLIILAGDGWQEIWRRSKRDGVQEDTKEPNSEAEELRIENEFIEARTHLQRTLLKAAENLLKRPGKPLRSPKDIRFLLILLANPLLHPATVSPLAAEGTRGDQPWKVNQISDAKSSSDAKVQKSSSGRKSHTSSSWEGGHAFGIIKRILGLLSNLENECHHYLTSWFARYNKYQFRQLLDLIQAFVTYRLGRQEGRKLRNGNTEAGFIPGLSGTSAETSAQLHAALGLPSQVKGGSDSKARLPPYSTDWQVRAAARVMALLFAANKNYHGELSAGDSSTATTLGVNTRRNNKHHTQLLSTSDFYNTMVDYSDLVADFDTWESAQGRFSFCQYPFFLSVGAKIRIMEHDARRQMEVKAREAFFNSILRNKTLEQYLTLRVRRECLVEDSLKTISEVVGAGQEDIKKGLRVQFVDEEGIDAGGLRKEWFLLLAREIFEPQNGLFVYDEDSHFCYFNPYSFETSDQYFLVGALLGLAIYNSTILDIALPPFTFKKLLAAGSGQSNPKTPFNKTPIYYTLNDLAEYRPGLANGLRQLLDYEGDVETNLCLDFVAEVDRYGSKQQVPLCIDGAKRPVTNSNREEFVDLYVRYLLDTQVSRQFEPFKRGFFTVCGGNALSLFQPEEIELLIRGSDEPLDVPSLKAVAIYDNWRRGEHKVENPAEDVKLIQWFWEFFEHAEPKDQRKLLGFITGSDRIPAMGATSLIIKIAFAGKDYKRFPIARTCFNLLLLYKYRTKEELVQKLWRAVCESEGFGLK